MDRAATVNGDALLITKIAYSGTLNACACLSADWRTIVKPFTTIAVAVLALVAVAHLLRLLFSWQIVVAGIAVPVWCSVAGMVLAAGLAYMVWREARA